MTLLVANTNIIYVVVVLYQLPTKWLVMHCLILNDYDCHTAQHLFTVTNDIAHTTRFYVTHNCSNALTTAAQSRILHIIMHFILFE